MEYAQTPEEVPPDQKAALSAPSATYGQFTDKAAQYVVESVPIKHRARMTRVLGGGHASYRDRITAMCLQCSNFQFEEVRECRVWKCPLHQARPYQQQEQAANAEADPAA